MKLYLFIYWKNGANPDYKYVSVTVPNIFNWGIFNKFLKVFNSINNLNKVDIMPEDVIKILKDLEIKEVTRYV